MTEQQKTLFVYHALVDAAFALCKARATAPDEIALVRINNAIDECDKVMCLLEEEVDRIPDSVEIDWQLLKT